MSLQALLSRGHYAIVIALLLIGLVIVVSRANLIKKLIGLSLFQTAVFMLYIAMGKVRGGTAPILAEGLGPYSNPVPHVLILTAIVVGVATTAVGLAIVVRIHEAYGSIEEDELVEADRLEESHTDPSPEPRS